MTAHQLWYGGSRMAARDIWSSDGNGYWPNQVAVADNGLRGIAAQFTDGRDFNIFRRFRPETHGDVALYEYLNNNAAQPAVGDVFNLIVIPAHHHINYVTATLDQLPPNVTFAVELFDLQAGTAVANTTITLNAAAVGTGVKSVSVGAKYTNDVVVRLRVTARSDASDVVWEAFKAEVGAVGYCIADLDPIISSDGLVVQYANGKLS